MQDALGVPLTPAKLAQELRALKPQSLEPLAAKAFATAFTNYFADSVVAGIPANPATLAPAKAALLAGLTGMSTPGAAPLIIQQGITLFWLTIIPTAITVWPGVVPPIVAATPPPGLAAIAAAIIAAGLANITSTSLAQSAQVLAAAIHPTQLGGTVAVAPPPAIIPIL
jgi:hypothetical protein